VRRLGLLAAAAACAAVALASAAPAGAQSDGWFVERPFADPSFTLDDLGVVDYEGDGDLDVFTTNHLSTQLLMANDGTGSFADRLTAAGLNQTPEFPGWEDDPNVPDQSAPGLYIYREGGIVVRLVGEERAVSGQIEFLAPVTVAEATGAQVSVTRDFAQQPPRNVARFSMAGGSTLRLIPESTGLPIAVSIDPPYQPADVFVGRRKVTPSAPQFTLYQRDRHGMAWADYNHDGHIDAFVTRGGVSGNIKRYEGVIQDELLLGDGSGFRDAIAGTGITKGTCRGRAAGAVDYNRDGLIDVFADCFGDSPMLFRQRRNGSFKNVSGPLERARVRGTAFEWLDLHERGGEELIAARTKKFDVYSRRRGKWARAEPVKGRHDANAQKLAVADYDNDGDPDVFAAAKSGSSLLVNRRGRLERRRPQSVGLPSRALTANWVDYDNDGLADLHLVPGGIFRQVARHRFAQTGLALPGDPAVRAIASWFDFNADGARDAVLAVRRDTVGKHTELRLLENVGAAGHWLEVELTGPPGNRQALGAKVSAKVPGKTLTQWVGQSDGSQLSQGHYRLYFGLGTATGASLKVTWPDGSVRRLGAVGADRIVRIAQGG
jgi:ASPIC and UnbV/FG-GAP-like repeat